MESHGVPGRIQVSEAFYLLAKDAFQFEERGPTTIKGLGATHTYFLIGPIETAMRPTARAAEPRSQPATDALDEASGREG
jgi:class 3 adenylate cyclase